MRKLIYLSYVLCVLPLLTFAQEKDWNAVDFVDDYKIKYKISGGAAKLLLKEPTFINDYSISQATLMKGSSQPGTLQKQGTGAVFAEAALGGVSKEEFQQMVEECHQHFKDQLNEIGFQLTDGKAVVNSKFAQKKKGKKKTLIGKTTDEPIFQKVSFMQGSDIKEILHFRPKNQYVVAVWKDVSTIPFRLSSKEDVNTISINYEVRFANFEGIKKGLSENTLKTKAGLSIVPSIVINNPKGKKSMVYVKKRIYGGNSWAKGMVKTSEKDGDWLGLSSSADYALAADSQTYLQQLKSIIIAFQNDLIKGLQQEM